MVVLLEEKVWSNTIIETAFEELVGEIAAKLSNFLVCWLCELVDQLFSAALL